MRSQSLVSPTFLLCAFLVASCAKGTTLSPLDGDGGEGGTSNSGGEGGSPGTTSMGGTTTTSTTADGGGMDTGGAGGMAGSGGGGGAGGSGGMGGAGGSPCDFTAQNNCATAEGLPAVSGDEGGTATASGTGSKWLKVQIQETDSSIFASDLSYMVSLTSPPGMDYDLYVKQGPEDGNPDCGATAQKGVLGAGSESVSADWNDDQGIGGEDDSLWLSIEVRHVSGDDCNAKWSLTVIGNP